MDIKANELQYVRYP